MTLLLVMLAFAMILEASMILKIFDTVMVIANFATGRKYALIIAFIILGMCVASELILFSFMIYDAYTYEWLDILAPKYSTLMLVVISLNLVFVVALIAHTYKPSLLSMFIPLAFLGIILSGVLSYKSSVISRRMIAVGVSAFLFFFLMLLAFYLYSAELFVLSIIARDIILLGALGKA